jgi:hypothetical protein
MAPIPGEPLEPKAPKLTTSDGRKVKLKIPGFAPPEAGQDRGAWQRRAAARRSEAADQPEPRGPLT